MPKSYGFPVVSVRVNDGRGCGGSSANPAYVPLPVWSFRPDAFGSADPDDEVWDDAADRVTGLIELLGPFQAAVEGQAPAGRTPGLPGMGSLLLPPWTLTRYEPDGCEMRGHFTRFHVGGNHAVHGGVLSGAAELRQGVRDLPTPNAASADNVTAMSMPLFFDFLGMRLNGAKAGDRRSTIVCELPDAGETWTLMLRHGTLSHHPGGEDGADATLTIDRSDLNQVILKEATLEDLLGSGTAKVDGDAQPLHDLLGLLDEFEFWFNIVTP